MNESFQRTRKKIFDDFDNHYYVASKLYNDFKNKVIAIN